MTIDASAFRDFEQAGWQRAAEHYPKAFGDLTSQAAGPLLDAAAVVAGTRVLDVAPELAIGFGLVVHAIERYGNPNVGLPEGPPFFQFSDVVECRRTLESAGFGGIDVAMLRLTWRLTSADEVFAAIAMGGVRTAAVLRAQTPDAIAQIRESVRHGVESYWTNEGAFEVPMLSVLASAKKH